MYLFLHLLFLYLKETKIFFFFFLQRNTFQLVIASTELNTYAILLYPKDSMHYFSTPVGGESRVSEAGFSQGEILGWFTNSQGHYYRIPSNAENTDVRELTE